MAEEHENEVRRGRSILTDWKEWLASLPVPDRAPGVDLQLAGLAGLETYEELERQGVFESLRTLQPDVFDASCIERTRDASLALLAAVRDLAGWTPPTVKVPEDLLLRATWLRGETCEVALFALAHDEDAVKRIRGVLRGQGHWDLYDDLGQISELYEDHAEDLEAGGGLRYKPEHGPEAAELAEKLRKALMSGGIPADSPLAVAYKVFRVLEEAHQELLDGVWIRRRKLNRKPGASLRARSRRPARIKGVRAVVVPPPG